MRNEKILIRLILLVLSGLVLASPSALVAVPNQTSASQTESPSSSAPPVTPKDLGVTFVDGSGSQVVVERGGKKYLIDLVRHEIKEVDPPASSEPVSASTSAASASGQAQKPAPNPSSSAVADTTKNRTYTAGDDLLFDVPTGRRVERHGLYIDFTHRFPYEPAFTTPGRGNTLLGLDDFAIPSFGFRYGLTSRLYVFAYRSPSIIGRPIELMAGYNLLDERDDQPFNLAARFSVDGQNNFQRNFAENFELIASRSITRHAQFYAVPTFTIHARPLLQNNNPLADAIPDQPCSAAQAAGASGGMILKPCVNTISIGLGASVDIRKTAALIAEVTPTLVNASDLGIHRPEFAFGIQKKIWRHAFTLGFGNGPATIVSERAGTNATFLGNPAADKPSNIFIGFDLSRQIF
jgi:Membrane bound beta barrel domain (DUF5777)